MANETLAQSAIILGAGPTGLSTAWQLVKRGWRVTIIEKEQEVGGHGGTRTIHGYAVDDGPHKLYPQVPCAMPLIEHFVGDRLERISKKSTIYLKGKYIPYPFGLVDLIKGLGILSGVRSGLGLLWGKFLVFLKRRHTTYTDFVLAHFGTFAHTLVFRPVARKLWGDPDQLHIQLAKTRIIAPKITDLITSVFTPFKNKPKLSADIFYYPKGGLCVLWEAMSSEIEQLGGKVMRSALPARITRNAEAGIFTIDYTTSEGTHTISAPVVVSTIPFKTAYELLNPAPPSSVMEAVVKLKLSSLLVLYLVVDVPRVLEVNWIFIPEERYHFARISEQKGFSESMVPPDRSVLMVEIPLARKEIRDKDKETLAKEAIAQLREIGLLKKNHNVIEHFFSYDASIYPVYDLHYQTHLETILAYSDRMPNFYLNGRLGLFCYNNMDHSMEMGMTLADHIVEGKSIAEWKKAREAFYEYKIVD